MNVYVVIKDEDFSSEVEVNIEKVFADEKEAEDYVLNKGFVPVENKLYYEPYIVPINASSRIRYYIESHELKE